MMRYHMGGPVRCSLCSKDLQVSYSFFWQFPVIPKRVSLSEPPTIGISVENVLFCFAGEVEHEVDWYCMVNGVVHCLACELHQAFDAERRGLHLDRLALEIRNATCVEAYWIRQMKVALEKAYSRLQPRNDGNCQEGTTK